MSQEALRTGRVPDDAVTSKDYPEIDHERAPTGTRQPLRRPPLRARPQSWHPYGPVEPPLELSTSRPIDVHAILNPVAQTANPSTSSSREPLSLPGPSVSPRPRQGSSPVPRSARPLVQQPLSPKSHPRPLLNTTSPLRFVGSGRTSGRSSVSHSPLVPQEPPLAPRQPIASSTLPLDTALRTVNALPGTQPPSTSLYSTPSIHSRRNSSGPGSLTTPITQVASPISPHSGYDHFGRASPAVTSTAPTSYSAATSYMTPEYQSCGIPATAGPHSMTEERGRTASIPGNTTALGGLIPCVLDLKSGSSSQAEKRKANSDASRRFRNRKRNEMQLEQRLSAQQDEIQRYVETVHRQTEEIRSLIQQRNHYRSERDFFRDQLGRSMPSSQLPQRPPTPLAAQRALHSTESAVSSAWTDVPRQTAGVPGRGAAPQVLDPARLQSTWSGSRASYSPTPPSTGQSSAPAPRQAPAGAHPTHVHGSWSHP